MKAKLPFAIAIALAVVAIAGSCAAPKSNATATSSRHPVKIDFARCEHDYQLPQMHISAYGENPQGPFLEGIGFERRHFVFDGSTPEMGVPLHVESSCGGNPTMTVHLDNCGDLDASTARCIATVGRPSDLKDDPKLYLDKVCNLDVPEDGSVRVGVTLIRGLWDKDGAYQYDGGQFTLSCNASAAAQGSLQQTVHDGAIAKCLNDRTEDGGFGYPPSDWNTFLACIRAVRADYCGDGRTGTKSGTVIEIFDRSGKYRTHCSDAGLCLEAEWNEQGAVCISHARWVSRDTEFPVNCPGNGLGKHRFDELGTCGTHCRADAGATLLVTRSKHQESDGNIIPCDPTEADPDCNATTCSIYR